MKILPPLIYPGTFKKIKPGTPTYVIAGEKDIITTVSEQQGLAKSLASKFSVIEGQAHCIMLEPKYKLVVESIDNWIKNLK